MSDADHDETMDQDITRRVPMTARSVILSGVRFVSHAAIFAGTVTIVATFGIAMVDMLSSSLLVLHLSGSEVTHTRDFEILGNGRDRFFVWGACALAVGMVGNALSRPSRTNVYTLPDLEARLIPASPTRMATTMRAPSMSEEQSSMWREISQNVGDVLDIDPRNIEARAIVTDYLPRITKDRLDIPLSERERNGTPRTDTASSRALTETLSTLLDASKKMRDDAIMRVTRPVDLTREVVKARYADEFDTDVRSTEG